MLIAHASPIMSVQLPNVGPPGKNIVFFNMAALASLAGRVNPGEAIPTFSVGDAFFEDSLYDGVTAYCTGSITAEFTGATLTSLTIGEIPCRVFGTVNFWSDPGKTVALDVLPFDVTGNVSLFQEHTNQGQQITEISGTLL